MCVCVLRSSLLRRRCWGRRESWKRPGRGWPWSDSNSTSSCRQSSERTARSSEPDPGHYTHTHTSEDEEIIHHMQRVKSEPCIRMSILKVTFMSIVMPALLFCCILKICHICKLILISIKFYNFFFCCCCFSTR